MSQYNSVYRGLSRIRITKELLKMIAHSSGRWLRKTAQGK